MKLFSFECFFFPHFGASGYFFKQVRSIVAAYLLHWALFDYISTVYMSDKRCLESSVTIFISLFLLFIFLFYVFTRNSIMNFWHSMRLKTSLISSVKVQIWQSDLIFNRNLNSSNIQMWQITGSVHCKITVIYSIGIVFVHNHCFIFISYKYI